jgi:hypothetical protein
MSAALGYHCQHSKSIIKRLTVTALTVNGGMTGLQSSNELTIELIQVLWSEIPHFSYKMENGDVLHIFRECS